MKKRTQPLWEARQDEIPYPLRAWLLYTGSFMQRLMQQGVADARVQVLQEHWLRPTLPERALLGLDSVAQALVREVLILSEGKHWMFARTVIPRCTLTEEEQLAHLKERSLGSVLFKDPTLKRSEFEIACLRQGESWHDKVQHVMENALPDLWARRSLFSLRGKSLLLTEVFLPDIVTL